jgi:hypothetical protein
VTITPTRRKLTFRLSGITRCRYNTSNAAPSTKTVGGQEERAEMVLC